MGAILVFFVILFIFLYATKDERRVNSEVKRMIKENGEIIREDIARSNREYEKKQAEKNKDK